MNKKRMSLYFNLDVPSDKSIWEYLESNGRKSELVKRLIVEDIKKNTPPAPIEASELMKQRIRETIENLKK